MPGKVKVRIVAGRNLPVMDRASDTCDAFVEIKLSNTTYKTEVFRHSLNPEWNSEWFRFEVDDEELQDEPLQIRVMDYDTYSANDAIGKVYIDLNPLLCKEAGSLLSGWFPIYDTMHGIRGEINVMVRVHLFSDSNKYRESSCGVQFFYSGSIPWGFKAQAILGFVEELVVNDDPEYQWIDKIRTPRASNEARQTLFSKLSGEVQRKIGLKALELGGNAVIGYHQCFDLEGESGIVVRGIGTAVILTQNLSAAQYEVFRESPVLEEQVVPGTSSPTACHSPAKGAISSAHRRSSDSDLSATPKGGSLGDNSCGLRSVQRPAVAQESLSMLEYPFITMRQFPAGFIQHIGGVVSARSVKLLVQINNPDEPETRDAWWTELRKEIRSHIRALGCNVVLGYMETTNISDDICVLSASGTAAVLCTSDQEVSNISTPALSMNLQPRPSVVTTGVPGDEKTKEIPKDKPLKIDVNLANQIRQSHLHDWSEDLSKNAGCKVCHIPYSESSIPFPTNLVRCNVCRKAKVPDVLFMTIEPPPNISVNGKSCLLQARVCKNKKDGKGEQNAKEISDSLPFLEYELHRQLLNKLKVKCMNAIFGLKVQVSIGDKLIIGIATGTGAYLAALPPPTLPKLACGKVVDERKMSVVQRQIQEAMDKNREYFGIKLPSMDDSHQSMGKSEDGYSSEEDLPDIDLSAGNKDACILEVDDADDVDIISQLIDPKVPPGFDLCNTETLPGLDNFMCNLQMFTRIFRTKFSSPPNGNQVSKTFESVIKSLFVKLRRLVPCCLTNLTFQVDLVEQDELQVTVLGIAIGLGEFNSSLNSTGCKQYKQNDSELMFHMEVEKSSEAAQPLSFNRKPLHSSDRSYCYHMSLGEHNGVDITPLTYIPGKKIEQYLGDLDFFFIRESSSIRESGGLNGFIQSFVAETLAIVRAHVSALGGNAMVGFHMTQCILLHNPHKNQGQCLVNVAGDAVFVQLPTTQVADCDEVKLANFEVQDSYGP
ncbi:C2 domain-containing protein 5 isoform X3 [Parasteatoda tepidariorum]|uniref:C2 domain-containing protein 5 isoform X3 n=1 Tax=Parasteatoda tepidariorum TaxID=114398 RepID=UPI000A2C0670|nr:C2 domain-containing protein 5 isoform X1 [Parasteatoda tepidariorum]XP_042908944.1 C2 domain-containing protein 5 isoform X1 [Parasteatoda tepidariorum]XP_042908945.1 C2 domain-containing protein 5 isoform X1 [Parasteatoda tepidariorum]